MIEASTSGRFIGNPSAWGVTGRVNGRDVLAEVTRQRQPGSRFGNVSPHLFYAPTLKSIGGFPNDNAGPGDLETFIKLLCVTDVCFVEERLCRYRVRPGSMGARTFGLRECTDFARMVDKLEAFFDGRPDLPAHLRDPEFMRAWKVWAAGHNIFASYQLKLRGRPNQFDEIKAMFAERGLGAEFDALVSRGLPRHVRKTLGRKLRRLIGLPQDPPLMRRWRRTQAPEGARG